VAELVFSGTMDCGKSTLALQVDHNHSAAGRGGLRFTRHDSAGEAVLSSRLGLAGSALEVTDDLDFWRVVVEHRMAGERVDYLICDEAQFYSPAQVDQLACVVDEMGVDVFAGYEVLCRRHHMRRQTRATAHAPAMSPDLLPLQQG
jgi:thymidine kinase